MNFIKKYWIVIVGIFGLSVFIKPALCFLILGLLLSYLGFEAIKFLKSITKKGIDCIGNIIEYQSDSDGHKTPLIEFTTMTGDLIREKPHIYASTDLSKIRSYKNLINQSVPILYDPDDPKKFILTAEKEFNYFSLVLLFIVSSVFIIVSISSLLGYIKLS